MAKWKCEICGNEFDNFHAQGFDNKIYCPLCFFKKENQEVKSNLEDIYKDYSVMQEENEILLEKIRELKKQRSCDKLEKLTTQQKVFIKYLEDEIEGCELTSDLIFNHNKEMKVYKEVLQKYKEIIGDDK